MDLSFLRRRRSGLASRAASALDYRVLIAMLEAMQSASPAARAARSVAPPKEEAQPDLDPLVELLLGGPEWREAARAQRGSFNPDQAAARGGRKRK